MPPRPSISTTLPVLAGLADPSRYAEVVGERIALLGEESGVFEGWMWPLKLFHDLKVEARNARGERIDFEDRRVAVTPSALELSYRGEEAVLVQRMIASREERGLLLLFTWRSAADLELEISFTCDFRPMWPAGMGGQIAAPDPATGAFVLTEELGRFAAILGGKGAELVSTGGDHGLPSEPVRFRVALPAKHALDEPFLFAIAGAELDPGPLAEEARLGRRGAATGFGRAEKAVSAARALWSDLQAGGSERESAQTRHWSSFLDRTVALGSADERRDQAFLWSKIAIERAWVRVDGLGRGLAAGLGPSRGGERPGFAWFFDGDAMVASRAMCAYGDFEGAREVLRFAASHQRVDGKLMHELTLSARLCNWLEDYPYAFYKGLNAADFVAALDHFLRWSGDLASARELFPNARRAIEWCASACNARGLMSNSSAGLAAVEAGPLVERIECDLFLQGAWIAALHAGSRLAAALGEESFRLRCEDLARKANAGLSEMWVGEKERFAFAALVDGKLADDLSAYLAPATLHAEDDEKARATAAQLNRPEVASDWGLRMFATDSAVYDPRSYNTGAVFPYLTGFAVQALFARGQPMAARQVLDSQFALWGIGGRGFVEEHFLGDRARISPRSVPHQIFSSAALVEPVLSGWLGIAPDAVAGRLLLCASLSPEPAGVRVERLRVGETTLDLAFRREPRAEGGTRIGYRLRRMGGPRLSIAISHAMTPLSRVLVARANGEALEIAGGRRLELQHLDLADELDVAIDLLEGPALILPSTLPAVGETSRHPRIAGVRALGEHEVEWSIHGLAGTRIDLPFRSDIPCSIGDVSGGTARFLEPDVLQVSFGAGRPGEFVPTKLRLRERIQRTP